MKMITVFFRYDDYSSRSNTDLEVKYISAFKEAGFCCLFGIIPFAVARDAEDTGSQELLALPSEKAALLREAIAAGVVEPALHGYSHQGHRQRRGFFSEFKGLKFEDQLSKLASGKEFLEDILETTIDIFIPPWNSYDTNTLRALNQLGLRWLCADHTGVADRSLPLRMLPVTCGPQKLRSAVHLVRASRDPDPLIGVLFHEFDVCPAGRWQKMTYDEFVDTLRWLKEQKDVVVLSAAEALRTNPDLGARRLLLNRLYQRMAPLSPMFLRKLYPTSVYYSSHFAFRSAVKRGLLLTAFYLCIVAASGALAEPIRLILDVSPVILHAVRTGVLGVLLASLVLSLRDLRPSFRDAIAVSVVLGFCIGMFV